MTLCNVNNILNNICNYIEFNNLKLYKIININMYIITYNKNN